MYQLSDPDINFDWDTIEQVVSFFPFHSSIPLINSVPFSLFLPRKINHVQFVYPLLTQLV